MKESETVAKAFREAPKNRVETVGGGKESEGKIHIGSVKATLPVPRPRGNTKY